MYTGVNVELVITGLASQISSAIIEISTLDAEFAGTVVTSDPSRRNAVVNVGGVLSLISRVSVNNRISLVSA